MLKIRKDVEQAAARMDDRVRQTPCQRSSWLSETTGAEVYLKLENFQVTGSFKARGAIHKLLSIDAATRRRGVVAASSGNHGAGVAYGAQLLGTKALVYVPIGAAPSKVDAIASYGAKVVKEGADCVEAEAAARAYGAARGMVYISPYNDYEVLLGQGTVGAEIEQQVGPMDAIFVALGGGGLISGVGGYLKAANPRMTVVACSPERSPAMHECMGAGKVVEVACHDTLSDATAGGVEQGAITLDTCLAVVDRSILLTEGEIARATRGIILREHMLVEGAAGLALAGFLKTADTWRGKRVAIVLCGANIGEQALARILGTP